MAQFRHNVEAFRWHAVGLPFTLCSVLVVAVAACAVSATTSPRPTTLITVVPNSTNTSSLALTPESQSSTSTVMATEEDFTTKSSETPILATLQMGPTMTDSQCRIRKGQPLGEVEVVVMPPVDVPALIAEDAQRGKDEPPRFAQPIAVQLNPATNGTWENLDDDTLLWRLRITSPGAISLNLGFTRFFMPTGGCLFVYRPDYGSLVGPFTDQDNEEHGQLWTPILKGDDIVIEVSLPASALSHLELELTSVNHGYKDFDR